MKVNVKYFASIRESVGAGSEQLDTRCATLGALRDELIARGGSHAQSLARGRRARGAEPGHERGGRSAQRRLRSGLLPTRHRWLMS